MAGGASPQQVPTSALNLTYLSSLGPPVSFWGRGWKLLLTLLKVKF